MLTGFEHNAVTCFGMKTEIPVNSLSLSLCADYSLFFNVLPFNLLLLFLECDLQLSFTFLFVAIILLCLLLIYALSMYYYTCLL